MVACAEKGPRQRLQVPPIPGVPNRAWPSSDPRGLRCKPVLGAVGKGVRWEEAQPRF